MRLWRHGTAGGGSTRGEWRGCVGWFFGFGYGRRTECSVFWRRGADQVAANSNGHDLSCGGEGGTIQRMTATTSIGSGFQVWVWATDRDERQTTGDNFQTRGDQTEKGTAKVDTCARFSYGGGAAVRKGKAATAARGGNLRVSSSFSPFSPFSFFSFLFFLLCTGPYAYLNTNRIPIKFLFPFSLFYFKQQLLSLLKQLPLSSTNISTNFIIQIK